MHVKVFSVLLGVFFVGTLTAGLLGQLPVTSPTIKLTQGVSAAAGWSGDLAEAGLESSAEAASISNSRSEDINLLARVVAAEAQGEPLAGQAAVAAVILNRVRDPGFPKSLSGVILQPHAFESVSNGLIWSRSPDATAVSAARSALNGWDPTYGSLFFWNPSKPVSRWIWTRRIIARIGSHVFGL